MELLRIYYGFSFCGFVSFVCMSSPAPCHCMCSCMCFLMLFVCCSFYLFILVYSAFTVHLPVGFFKKVRKKEWMREIRRISEEIMEGKP